MQLYDEPGYEHDYGLDEPMTEEESDLLIEELVNTILAVRAKNRHALLNMTQRELPFDEEPTP